jgi:hypothetical protein
MRLTIIFLALTLIIMLQSCQNEGKKGEPVITAKHQIVLDRIKDYAPMHLSTDLSFLSQREKILVRKLAEAGKIADKIFWKQSSHDAVEVRDSLMALNTQEAKDFLTYLNINYGPYDPIYENKRFVGNGPEIRPKCGGFYPEDMTKDEFESYLTNYPEKAESMKSQYSVVVRENGTLKDVPYHVYYKETEEIAKKLEEAAEYADNESLKKYLILRAKAFRTDDYFESDLAWMDIKNSNIDFVIGPIENYQDEIFNYKSAYEAVVMVKDPDAAKELDMFKANLLNFENSLPIDAKFKQKSLGDDNIIQIMNVVYFGGDCQKAIKTIAAALPNDPKVADAKRRKLSMYKNQMEAKFDKIVSPIGKMLLNSNRTKFVDKKAFTSFVTLHEVSHALGPKYVFGTKDEIRRILKDKYSAIEECKADILSIYNHKYLVENGLYDQNYIEKAKATYLAGLFRSIRFGTGAHAIANLIQLNFLREQGAIYKTTDGKLDIKDEIFFEKVGELAQLILLTQVNGDYDKAGYILMKYGKMSPELLAEVDLLKSIPRDINTTYDF